MPTNSTLRINNTERINVGVWKKSGVLNYSTTDGNAISNNNIGTSTWDQSNGYAKTYGNGTKNGVVAYVVENKGTNSITCLETAQKRD